MEVLTSNQNELINLHEQDDGSIAVSGRELHEFLEIGTPYRKWFPRMVEYGFVENIDYTPDIFVHPLNNQDTVNHILTIDMAKEISMIQRNEKGKQARRYFIEVEKAWNSPEMIMKRALQIADRKIDDLQEQIVLDRPKVLLAESISASDSTIAVGDLAKLLGQNGIEIGRNRLFEWLRENGFLISQKGIEHNMPTQRSMKMKLFEIREGTRNSSQGIKITKTPRVTGKGQEYFINKFLNEEANRNE